MSDGAADEVKFVSRRARKDRKAGVSLIAPTVSSSAVAPSPSVEAGSHKATSVLEAATTVASAASVISLIGTEMEKKNTEKTDGNDNNRLKEEEKEVTIAFVKQNKEEKKEIAPADGDTEGTMNNQEVEMGPGAKKSLVQIVAEQNMMMKFGSSTLSSISTPTASENQMS